MFGLGLESHAPTRVRAWHLAALRATAVNIEFTSEDPMVLKLAQVQGVFVCLCVCVCVCVCVRARAKYLT